MRMNLGNNGMYIWRSIDKRSEKPHLEISSECYDNVGLNIHHKGTYTPIGLSPEQAKQVVESIKNKKPAVISTLSRYGTTEIFLTVLYEVDEIIFLARYNDSISGIVVNYSLADEIIEVLLHGAELAQNWIDNNKG